MANIDLPDAPNFSRHLNDVVKGALTVSGPKEENFGKTWTVSLDGELIGLYTVFSEPGQAQTRRQYTGRIPGYINKSIQRGNQGIPIKEQRPVDTVGLIFSNEVSEDGYTLEGVETPWKRQDEHNSIPFP